MLAFAFVLTLPAIAFGATVILGTANVTGLDVGPVSKFLGIPFASAPRFDLPIAIRSYVGAMDATKYGPACIQQLIFGLPSPLRTSEDCLSINVIKPINTGPSTRIPVVVWIYGGGFLTGNTKDYDDMGTRIVQKSVQHGLPVMFVSMNYRVSAYGFLASSEVYDEGIGNFGLYDQHAALKWIQTNIHSFGGDRTRVTLWGQSAGAISISLQMLAFGGNTQHLFRGAFMQSGGPIPVDSMLSGQTFYDELLEKTGCNKSETDTLHCLRTVSLVKLQLAVNASPNFLGYRSLVLAWSPRTDGVFLQEAPMKQILAGKIANIPVVSGNCDDEGTVFSVSPKLHKISTEENFRDYIRTIWAPGATEKELAPFWTYYPSDPAEGSPFDTGDEFEDDLYLQFKRMAAFQNDLVFHAPRRFLLKHLSGKQRIWSYLSKRLKNIGGGPRARFLGSFHGSDIPLNLTDTYVINFVNKLDPNVNQAAAWPEYTFDSPKMLTFIDEQSAPIITSDTYRFKPMEYLSNLSLAHPL